MLAAAFTAVPFFRPAFATSLLRTALRPTLTRSAFRPALTGPCLRPSLALLSAGRLALRLAFTVLLTLTLLLVRPTLRLRSWSSPALPHLLFVPLDLGPLPVLFLPLAPQVLSFTLRPWPIVLDAPGPLALPPMP